MLRVYLIVVIAMLAGLLALALLMRLGRRNAEGSALLTWRHVISAAVGLVVFFGAASLLEVVGTGMPGTNYKPPHFEGGEIKPGKFNKSEMNKGALPTVKLASQPATGQLA
jgi:NADH:ubiquinone oxidoreductase subunit 3 (subunit A)